MKALTLWRPWPYAIFRLGKDVENRTWQPWESIIGQKIALHVGKTWDRSGAEFIMRVALQNGGNPALINLEWDKLFPAGHIIGTIRVTGYYKVGDLFERGSPWAFGPYCWKLADPVELPEPVPCRGAQGLWTISEEVLKQIQ